MLAGRIAHERPVDLQLGKRNARELLERGIAGTAVIDRQAEATQPQPVEVLEDRPELSADQST